MEVGVWPGRHWEEGPATGEPAPRRSTLSPLHTILCPLTRAALYALLPRMSQDMPSEFLEPAPKAPVSNSQIYEALTASKGNLAEAARALSFSRTYLVGRVQKVPALMALLEDLRETIVDRAEQNQYAEVLAGDAAASRFILQTLGKNRGYSMGVAGTGKDGAITVEIRSFTEKEPSDG